MWTSQTSSGSLCHPMGYGLHDVVSQPGQSYVVTQGMSLPALHECIVTTHTSGSVENKLGVMSKIYLL